MTVAGPRQVQVQLDTGLRRDVGKLSLLFTGVGAIIGSGWLFGALYASQLAGPSAVLSWIVGAILVMIIGLVYSELAVMFPVSGGIIRFPHFAFGSFASFSSGWTSWIAAAAVTPIEVLATTQYADPYIPWLMTEAEPDVFVLTGPGLAVGIGLMAVYSLINVLGVKLFAQLNNALVWWKLAVIVLVVVAFFVLAFSPGNFTNFGGFAPSGFGAVFTAIPAAGVAFAYLGFRNGVEFAGETDNPQRNVPFAVVGSILITGVIYVLLQVAFITGVPPELLGGGWTAFQFEEGGAGPLAALASLLGAVWLAVLLRVDAVVSPADTGLIYAGVTTRLSYANARNGNAPQWLTRLNARGIPWLSVLLMFVVGCFMFLPFPGWAQFIGFITSAFAVSFGAGPLVVGALRRQLPDQERPFKLPGGDTLPFLAFLASGLLVFWAGWAINESFFIALILGYVLFAIYQATNGSQMPPLDFKAGSWFPIWVVGLGVISYFSNITPGEPDDPGFLFAGNDGPLDLVWGPIVLVVFSAAVYAYAMSVRLPSERAAAYISQTPVDEPRTA